MKKKKSQFFTDFDELPTSGAAHTDISPQCSKLNPSSLIVTHEAVRPHPKSQARKFPNRSHPKGKSCILNNTPETLVIKAGGEKKQYPSYKPVPKARNRQVLFYISKWHIDTMHFLPPPTFLKGKLVAARKKSTCLF